MMLRIHFTGEDLAKVRLAAKATARWETALTLWDQAMAHVEADRAKRARAWLDGGCEGLLNSYRPLMRWQYPVLEVNFDVEQDVYLQSRGLLLVPSYFSRGMPDTLLDPTLVPMLVYPVGHDPRRAGAEESEGGAESLAALIGSTRAWVLGAIEEGCTTGELARRVGINASSVSQHTTVLRAARLIQSNRIGKAMLHTLTPLGIALLQGT